MGMSVGGKKGGPMAEINVTPLVDVMLVLIIIFMVVTPALTAGVDVRLPAARSVEEGQDLGQNIAIAIKQDESVYVGTEPVAPGEIITAVNEEYKKDGARSLLIKADRRLTWKQVYAVMNELNEGGMSVMLLAVEKEKE
jgi:biopolymer transport protein TolR